MLHHINLRLAFIDPSLQQGRNQNSVAPCFSVDLDVSVAHQLFRDRCIDDINACISDRGLLYNSRLMMLLVVLPSALPKPEYKGVKVAKKKRVVRKEYTALDVKELKAHSKARTPVSRIAKIMKRTEGSLRQKARSLGIGLGHQR